MSWLSYIFPQTKLISSSKYNRLIRVNEESGKYKLLVNGCRQSGAYIEMLWKKAFRTFYIQSDQSVKSILVLGVGGGTVIHLLHTLYPKALITGVDIDTKMITIGKNHFGLNTISGLTLITADAQTFVRKSGAFDLVIVDLFVGGDIPDLVSGKEFLIYVRKRLGPNGRLVINYLQERTYKEKSNRLKISLQSIFPRVSDVPIERNRFFLGRNGP